MEEETKYGNALYAKLFKQIEGKTVYPLQFPLNGIFWISLETFAEATRCFDSASYEATAIMCRNSLDSGIFEALIKRDSGSNYAEWDLKQLDGFDKDYFAEYLAAESEKKEAILNEAIKKIRGVEWSSLKMNAISQELLSIAETEEIYETREPGDYSAHRASAISKDLFAAAKENREIKIRTDPEMAKSILTLTEGWLEKIMGRYCEKFHEELTM